MSWADLHLHTYHSDGVRSPQEVIDLARSHDLSVVAISDHDSLEAFFEIESYAREHGMTLVPGVELSCGYQGVDVHLLAYAFDAKSEPISSRLESFREIRRHRGERMVEKLVALGYPITLGRVAALCAGGAMGRPHIARALVESGVVESIDDAFETILSPTGPGYVPKARFDIDEAVSLIHRAGGVTSVAHPSLYPNHRQLVSELLNHGVDAIEVLHPDVPPDDRLHYEELAEQRGRFVTGGSDDHGFENRRTIGSVRIDVERIGPILERVV